ncbi:aldo/keto reductase [Pseudolysinimonas yzui]|uniref:aldo/keto reductase n=1 Tax=Pseudolysinimonas yzui TaxID=2708254 RepID=UPI00174AC781|nr:aldo/keto reductase [Pseudolysinimonas yzui]
MSELALGTMTFGAETPAREAHAMLDMFAEAGGNFIDTADAYGLGASEEIVGSWLRSNPELADRMIVATKARFAMSPDINDRGASRRHLTRAIDASLRRLQVDTIDLFQLHAWDPRTEVEETLSTLERAMSAGKILYYGLSNFDGWQISKTVMTAVLRGAPPPVSVQPQYSLVAREVEWEILPAARDAGLAILPWSPLGGGLLTGKYDAGSSILPTTRLGRLTPSSADSRMNAVPARSWKVLEAVRAISSESATSITGVALAWLLNQGAVSSVIVGAREAESRGVVDFRAEGVVATS